MRQGIVVEDGDLKIQLIKENGLITSGLVIDEVDYQNVDHLVIANKGEFKEHPILGVGAERYLKSVGRQEHLRREIAIQLEADGYKTKDISVSRTGIIEIDI